MTGTIDAIKKRKITHTTAKRFGVRVSYSSTGEQSHHYYPYADRDTGEFKATKKRIVEEKNFSWSGDRDNIGLFGQQTCKGRGKFITVTEGEIDAMSVSQMFGNKWDVVSVKDGAGSALRDIKANLEFLEAYDNVVLCFDNDKAGKKGTDDIRDLFTPNKCKIIDWPEGCSDANQMLKDGMAEAFVKLWWDAKTYRPDGIVAGSETWDALVEKRDTKSIPYPWEGLNAITRGHRPYELVTITSGSGMGKSQLIREIEYDLLDSINGNIGILALEEDISRTTLGIMSMAANRPLHLEEDTPVESLRPYWESTLGSGRYYLFDHWGSTSADNLLGRCRFMAQGLDCKVIVLDHLSIVVSSQENGDERKAIDEIMTRLRQLVAETGITLFLVSHLKRAGGVAHEDGGRISLSDLRGSQAIAQLSDIVIGMERDQQNEDDEVRNTTTVRVLKNRYTGETGPACYLKYDKDTGRMQEVQKPTDEGDTVEF